jgi:hypothetical protein
MKSITLLIAGIAVLAAGCSDTQDPISSTAETSPAAKLTVSGTATAGAPESGGPLLSPEKPQPLSPVELSFDVPLVLDELELTWLEIEDSRCPEGVECVWEGEVAIEVGAKRGDEDLGTVRLLLSSRDETAGHTRIGPYDVALLSVSPYPIIDVETDRGAYAATLSLSAARPDRPRRLTHSATKAGGGPHIERPLPENPRPPEPKPEPLPAEIVEALAEAQQRWESLALENYDYQYQRQCFCQIDYVRPMAVQVREGQIVSVLYADEEGGTVSEEIAQNVPTIDGLFSILRDAVDTGAASIQASYDEGQGYPRQAFIDYDFRIADEELGFSASELVPQP